MKYQLVNGLHTHLVLNGITYKPGAIKKLATKKEAVKFLNIPGNLAWAWYYDHRKLGMTTATQLLNNRGIE